MSSSKLLQYSKFRNQSDVSISVSSTGSLAVAKGVGMSRVGGGIRKKITGFTDQSRRRFQQVFLSLKRDALLDAWACRVSWPDEKLPTGDEVKRCIHQVGVSLARDFKGFSVLWKVEIEDRKSGKFKGRVVPHVHLVVVSHPGTEMDDFELWLRKSWFRIVGSGLSKHKRHGIHVQHVHGTPAAISWYISKYTSKLADDELLQQFGWVGRWWGVIGRKHLPVGPTTVNELSGQVLWQFKRFARRWLKQGKSGRRYARRIAQDRKGHGFTLLGMPEDRTLALILHSYELSER